MDIYFTFLCVYDFDHYKLRANSMERTRLSFKGKLDNGRREWRMANKKHKRGKKNKLKIKKKKEKGGKPYNYRVISSDSDAT